MAIKDIIDVHRRGPVKILGYRDDRYGARLCAMVNAWRLGCILDVPVVFGWSESEGVLRADAHRLFAPAFCSRYLVQESLLRSILANAKSPGPDNIATAQVGETLYIIVNRPFGDIDPAAVGASGALPSFDWAVKDMAPFNRKITRRVRENAHLVPEGATVFHVRRGDLADPWAPTFRRFVGRYVPYAFYRHFAETRGVGSPVRVFSDAPDAAAKLAGCGGRHAYAAVQPVVTGLSTAERAGLDMLLLARARAIVGGKSAFAESGARLGGVPYVRLHDAVEHHARRTLMYAEIERHDLDVGEFVSCCVNLAREESRAGLHREALALIARAEAAVPDVPAIRQIGQAFANAMQRSFNQTKS